HGPADSLGPYMGERLLRALSGCSVRRDEKLRRRPRGGHRGNAELHRTEDHQHRIGIKAMNEETIVRATIQELVVANRALAAENVIDDFGHVSARHPLRPDRFFLSRSRSPMLVTADDIMEFSLDGA